MAIGRTDLLRKGVDVVLLAGGVRSRGGRHRAVQGAPRPCRRLGRAGRDLPRPTGGGGPRPPVRHPGPWSARHHARPSPGGGWPPWRRTPGRPSTSPRRSAAPWPWSGCASWLTRWQPRVVGCGLRCRGDDPESLHAARRPDGPGLVARPRVARATTTTRCSWCWAPGRSSPSCPSAGRSSRSSRPLSRAAAAPVDGPGPSRASADRVRARTAPVTQSSRSGVPNDWRPVTQNGWTPMSAPRRAVIGSGVAGLTAAHVLSTRRHA